MRILWKSIFIVNDSYREEEYFNALYAAIKTQERVDPMMTDVMTRA